MKLWTYDGPIYHFGQIVVQRWVGQTYAPSRAKASVNLAYQAKKKLGLVASTQVRVDFDKIQQGGKQ